MRSMLMNSDPSRLTPVKAESEADLKTGKISVKSPIAQGLLGKSVGDKTEIQVPAGKIEFEILEISR